MSRGNSGEPSPVGGLGVSEHILIEQRVANEGPNLVVAYLLLIFLGLIGAHRFYLGRPGSAFTLIFVTVCTFFTGGCIWVLIDLFLVPGMVGEQRAKVRAAETARLQLSGRTRAEPSPPPPAVDSALLDRLLAK